jgi:hypothetical protein
VSSDLIVLRPSGALSDVIPPPHCRRLSDAILNDPCAYVMPTAEYSKRTNIQAGAKNLPARLRPDKSREKAGCAT